MSICTTLTRRQGDVAVVEKSNREKQSEQQSFRGDSVKFKVYDATNSGIWLSKIPELPGDK